MSQILAVVGTRPKVITLAPVTLTLRKAGPTARICSTDPHPDLAIPALAGFGISPDLALAKHPANLEDLAARLPACRLLDDAGAHARMARAHGPYGDGRALVRIARPPAGSTSRSS